MGRVVISGSLNRFIATAGGIGFLPLAPGTWASLITGFAWYFFSLKTGNDFFWQLAALAAVILVGAHASYHSSKGDDKDPTHVVIDEVAGMCVTLFLIPPTYMNFLAGFIFFRFFDIVKPFGIRRMEAVGKGWGIMLDDVLAGIFSNVLIHVILFYKIW